jgi:hypothetical protein
VLYDSLSSIHTAIDIMKIYFDATDIAHWAGHSDRVTGIQRVELNIVRSLARDHGGDVIRGIFFDRGSRAFYEFDPASLAHAQEFSAEGLLIDLGLQKTSRIFPSKVQIKSYLRQAARGKLQRTLKKADIYFSALLVPGRLQLPRYRQTAVLPVSAPSGSFPNYGASRLSIAPAAVRCCKWCTT